MNCPDCKGRGYIKLFRHGKMPCLECGGSGITSCCDAAGSCAPERARAGYRDEQFPERACDHCGKPYRGPAVYCSLTCAVEDA
jgi:Zn ribbon nucleic-acid-binding protein